MFSKLDLDQAFTRLKVDEDTAKVLTINTINGHFTVHRLLFGISPAPGIFQRLMEGLLADIPGIAILIDDISVSGKTKSEHDQRLKEVLNRLHTYRLKLKKNKCLLGA